MNKYLLILVIITAAFNVAANSTTKYNTLKVNPSTIASFQLLKDKCLYLDIKPLQLKNKLEEDIVSLEKKSLLINNINDAIVNFISQPESLFFKKEILNCQIKLSDSWRAIIEQPAVAHLIQELSESPKLKHQELALRLSQARNSQASYKALARLRAIEAEIRHWAKIKQPVLPSVSCRLPHQVNISDSARLHNYLLKQPNQQCRKTVWAKFYEQSTNLVSPWLQLKNNIAQQAGFNDFLAQELYDKILNKPENIIRYLDDKTLNALTSPWNIGQSLKQAKTSPYKKVSSQHLLKQSFKQLEKLGIYQQKITSKLYRIWFQSRFLGHLYIEESDSKIESQVIRHPVIGYQFADVRLTLPKIILSQRKAIQFVQSLSEAMTNLADSPPYYLSNSAMDFSDSNELGTIWLKKWLQKRLHLLAYSTDSREGLAQIYQQQLNIAKAKQAIALLTDNDAIQTERLFDKSNDIASAIVINYLYSDPSYFEETIDYYNDLFQNDLADLLIEHSKFPAEKTFSVLAINENRNSIKQRLKILLGRKFELRDIIKK